ncbi:MAG: hypothetical protein AB7F79_10060 [Steroidobacteraceae bacterium]
MEPASVDNSDFKAVDAELTPMQRAIRARALLTIENDQNRPKLSPRNKLLLGLLSVLTVMGLILMINWGVAVMQRIFELWRQDDTAVATPKSNDTFYIKVNPERPPPEVDPSPAPETK